MGALGIIFIIVLIIVVLWITRSFSLGKGYKQFLQNTQMNLISREFPQLTQGDIYDIMTTSTCDSIRWILQQNYYSYYTSNQKDTLVDLMDGAMIRGAVYINLESWITGMLTKQQVIELLNSNDIYRGMNTLEPNFGKMTEASKNSSREVIDSLNAQDLIEAYSKFQMGDLHGALREISVAIEHNPDNAIAYYLKGVIKDDLKDYSGAIVAYSRAIEERPEMAELYNNRGFCKYKLKEYEDAISDYSKAIELRPNYELAYTNRARAKNGIRDYNGAIRDCSEAIHLNPDYPEAYAIRGLINIELGQRESARIDLFTAAELGYSSANDLIKQYFD